MHYLLHSIFNKNVHSDRPPITVDRLSVRLNYSYAAESCSLQLMLCLIIISRFAITVGYTSPHISPVIHKEEHTYSGCFFSLIWTSRDSV